MKPETKQAERKPVCPALTLVPQTSPRVEWRISVNDRHGNAVDCTYAPADNHRLVKDARWIIWIDATSIDFVPALVAEGKRLLKINQAVGVHRKN